MGGNSQIVYFVSRPTSEVRIGVQNHGLEFQLKRFWSLESSVINKYEQSFYGKYVNLFVATNITGERSVTIQIKLCIDS